MSVHAEAPPPIVSEPKDYQYATGTQLGKGGFAICHRAELLDQSKPTGRMVALKIVKSKMEPPKLAQKFVTELQIHSKLHHPNIVEFYRAFTFQACTYVVLEICDNGSLADAIRKRKYFTMPEIRRFIIQTCGAVKYLHHRNIIHRDLKTGNLFLDKDMNIKVGDFGLAAVLMTQNDIGARRTTMCGTPNYLAPEILEKGGKGHNEKVDLWAIGIIAYTLAVGRAPFHAAKREDIYKKLQTRDYTWPDLSKTQNDISNDLKDLVGSLLVHEDDRPRPDQIVSHAFFKTAFVPLHLESECVNRAPKWSNIRPPTAEVLRRGYSDSWYKLCKESGVGEFAPGKVFPVIGGRKIRSVIRDCEKEVTAGRQPVVPIPADTVYLPFPERNNFPYPAAEGLSDIVEAEEKSSSAEGQALIETTANDRTKEPPVRPNTRISRAPPCKENVAPDQPAEIAPLERPKRRGTVRKTSEPVVSASEQQNTRISRAIKGIPATVVLTEDPQGKQESIVRALEARLESAVKSEKTAHPDSLDRTAARPAARQSQIPQSEPTIPHTDPTAVLARVSEFRDNVAQALANRRTLSRKDQRTQLPYVSKWVDYSRKHGVGYVLEDGSIGCIVNATQRHPVTHVLVRKGYTQLKEVGKDSSFVDRIPLEFYVDCANNGIRSITVDKDRKRATGILWAKFGRYMCQQLGQAEASAEEEVGDIKISTFVRFYQRLGTVGIWGFADGCFQFNFPDHTKLVLSPDGKYCNFTCLSVEAAQYLREHGDLPFKHIRQRKTLSGLVHTLLFGTADEAVAYREVTEANSLRAKLEFIVAVMDEWLGSGGLGRLSTKSQRMKWEGPQLDDGKKQEWVTVGRFGGDDVRS